MAELRLSLGDMCRESRSLYRMLHEAGAPVRMIAGELVMWDIIGQELDPKTGEYIFKWPSS